MRDFLFRQPRVNAGLARLLKLLLSSDKSTCIINPSMLRLLHQRTAMNRTCGISVTVRHVCFKLRFACKVVGIDYSCSAKDSNSQHEWMRSIVGILWHNHEVKPSLKTFQVPIIQQ